MTPITRYADCFDATASIYYSVNTPTECIRNATLALCSEVGEYFDNPSSDELGDIVWYHAMITRQCGFALDVVYSGTVLPAVAIQGLVAGSSNLASHLKKSAEKTRELDLQLTFKFLQQVAAAIKAACLELNTYLGSVMDENIKKLAARHPNGFNAYYADEYVK